MKRNLLIFSTIAICMTYWACKKNDSQLTTPVKFQDPFVTEAVSYLKANINNEDFEKLDLNSIQLMKTDGTTTGMMVYPRDKANHKSIILGKRDNKYISNWITFEANSEPDNGVILTENFDGTLKNEVTFLNGKAARIIKTDHGIVKTFLFQQSKFGDFNYKNGVSVERDMGVQATEINNPNVKLPEVIIHSYIHNSPITYYSLYTIFNQDPSYYNSYSTTPPSSNVGGGVSVGSIVTVEFENMNGPSINISSMFKCFTSVPNAGASYTVKLCADVPINGSPASSANPLGSSPGHSFLTVTKQNGAQIVTRTFGFYPTSNSLSPVQSAIKDDFNHEYNASIIMPISVTQFYTIQNNALAYSLKQYDVTDYNCANYAVGIFNSVRTDLITMNPLTVYLSSSMPPAPPSVYTISIASSPQMLFLALENKKLAGGIEAGNISIDQSHNLKAPANNGICN